MVSLDDTIPYIDLTIFQLLIAIITLVVGLFAVKLIVRLFRKSMKKTKLPALITEFIARFLNALLMVIIVLLFASALGFEIGFLILSLSAIFGLILAFGMQETFSNLFSGIWIAIIRPFNIGEVVTTNGQTGKVRAVGMMSTELLTPDNTFITIPNRLVWGSIITNYSRMPIRRVDVSVGISYGTEIDKALEVSMRVIKSHKLVLKKPDPAVVITELADSSVNLVLRAWTNTQDYWGVKGDLIKTIKEEFDKEKIEIPFPQLDVHTMK